MKFEELGYDSAVFAVEKIIAITKEYNTGPVAFCVCDIRERTLAAGNLGIANTYEKLAHAKAITTLRHEQATAGFRYEIGAVDLTEIASGAWTEFELQHAAQIDPDFCGFGGGVLLRNGVDTVTGSIGISGLDERSDHMVAARAAHGCRIAYD